MSWAAHQFEVYAIQAHLPKKMIGKVSFWGIFLGDFTPDFLSKFWVYGITIGGTHYGADEPHRWHRGWPGMGLTHTLFLGVLVAGGFWLWTVLWPEWADLLMVDGLTLLDARDARLELDLPLGALSPRL